VCIVNAVTSAELISSPAVRFVPQANRALRYFNIYLNTKQRSSSYSLFNPLRLFYRNQPLSQPLSQASARSTSPRSGAARSQAIPLAPIPPATNPRGELIFSSKVSAPYREGYEKYRADWEKKRKLSKRELGWREYILSVFTSRSPKSRAGTASNSESSEKQASVVYPASPPVTLTGATSITTRGRDVRARPLLRSNSSSSLSSTFSASPPQSRRSSPLRNSAGTPGSTVPSSPISSHPSTPDLIREEDEEEGLEGQEYFQQSRRAGQHSIKRVHSASEDSVLHSPDEGEASPERTGLQKKSSQKRVSQVVAPVAYGDDHIDPSIPSFYPNKYSTSRSRAEGLHSLIEKLADARTDG